MIELAEARASHDGITLRTLLAALTAHGGDLDTPLLIEADGEPVYIQAYLTEGS
jgi:hypothetical protein